MPTTPRYNLPFPVAGDPADVPGDVQALAEATDQALPDPNAGAVTPPLVTALPSPPADGDECYFVASAAAGVVWHLRYRAASASAYKWERLGGGDLFVQEDTTISVSPPGWSPGASPVTLTLPLAGDYDLEVGVKWMNAAANGETLTGFSVNGVDPPATDYGQLSAGTTAVCVPGAIARRKTALPAGAAVTLVFSPTVAALQFGRWMRARPVRVG